MCGSFAAELALGLDLDGLAEITGDTVLEILGGLPEEDRHCAFLAVETLQEAIDDYMCKRHGKEHPNKLESLKNLSHKSGLS